MQIKSQVIAMSILMLAVKPAIADETTIKDEISKKFPFVKVKSITKTQYKNLYEVFDGKELVYTDPKLNFIFSGGTLIDTNSRKDVKSERLAELTKVDFSAFPLDQAIKTTKGNGKNKIVVFSDPDCPYCKKLERESFSKLNDVTIYTFLFPIPKIHETSEYKSKAIWCSKDKNDTWRRWMLKDEMPTGTDNCENPITKNYALANKLDLSSTPNMYFENGHRIQGFRTASEINHQINLANEVKQ